MRMVSMPFPPFSASLVKLTIPRTPAIASRLCRSRSPLSCFETADRMVAIGISNSAPGSAMRPLSWACW